MSLFEGSSFGVVSSWSTDVSCAETDFDNVF